ncbi:MAG TPA: cupin domain-containing protein [Terriglobales bacterium]|nr:cupin domain-containing protein [Terriglobales bacterium]
MPHKSISRATAEHYSWGTACDAWHLVKEADLSVIEEQMPPASAEEFHSHRSAQQFFFLLSGELTMEVEQDEVRLRAGEGLHIRPRVQHRISNRSQESARFLVISQPPSHGDRVVKKPGA